MKFALFLTLSLPWLVVESVYAASYGRREAGDVVSVNGKPAICVPSNAKGVFAVSRVSLTESYTRNPPTWGASLLPGFKPLELSPGACIVLGTVPEGYEYDNYKIKARPLLLEVNQTYIFSLRNAYRSTDSYDAVFCVNKAATGVMEYLQYIRLADGSQIIPSCGGNRNTDPSSQDGTGDVDK